MSAGFKAAVADSVSVTMFSRSNSDPLISILSIRLEGLTVVGAPWALAAPTGPPLVLRGPQFPKFRPGRPTSLRDGLACTALEFEALEFEASELKALELEAPWFR